MSTPTQAGDYPITTESGRTDMLRHWSPPRGWSAPWYVGDDEDIVERARCTPAESPEDVSLLA